MGVPGRESSIPEQYRRHKLSFCLQSPDLALCQGTENSPSGINVFDVNQSLVKLKLPLNVFDHKNALNFSFLAFNFLPDFFHDFQVNTGHCQAPGGDNLFHLAETALEFQIGFLQSSLRFGA